MMQVLYIVCGGTAIAVPLFLLAKVPKNNIKFVFVLQKLRYMIGFFKSLH